MVLSEDWGVSWGQDDVVSRSRLASLARSPYDLTTTPSSAETRLDMESITSAGGLVEDLLVLAGTQELPVVLMHGS
jgi:hypothetical protein